MLAAAASLAFGQTTTRKLMTANVTGAKARIVTDAGIQTSTMNGQVAFHYQSSANGQPSMAMVGFNFIGSPVRTLRGSTGPVSLNLNRTSASTKEFVPSTGLIRAEFELVLHYRLIDQVLGQRKSGDDHFVSLTENMTGSFNGRFGKPVTPSSTTNTVGGAAAGKISRAVLGAIGSIEFELMPAVVQIVVAPCDSIGMRSLPIQPVFVRSGPHDPAPTGRSLDVYLENAERIWNKACVTFEVLDPVYVDDAGFKVLTEQESAALRATVDAANAVEVFFIESWDPVQTYGGGVTFSSGTADAQIITADNNIDQNPASLNNLAHELGHALTLCHPGTGCAAPRADGTAGTVMGPSGFWADNPDLQSRVNCAAASNPLLQFRAQYCCYRPDCEDDCRN
jgi:hypothetical protein